MKPSIQLLLFFLILAAPLPAADASRTVCGKNNMTKMADADELMLAMGRPIGRLHFGGSCSGVLIDKDLFLTARHCKASCKSISVKFGYLRDEKTYACKKIVEAGKSASREDYMIVQLEGDPGIEWGYYDVSDEALVPNQELLMIHHPGGKPMTISKENCAFVKEQNGLFYHRCDTNPGSSGSAVLIPDYENPEKSRVVAVHTMGGCNRSESSFNSGPSLRHLVSISPTLKALAEKR